MTNLTLLIAFTVIILFFAESYILFFLTKKFKLHKPSFTKAMITILLVDIAYILSNIVLREIFTGNFTIIAELLSYIVAFFAFDNILKQKNLSELKINIKIFITLIILSLFVFILLAIAGRSFAYNVYFVKGNSMSPIVENSEYIIVEKLSKKFNHNDIVAIKNGSEIKIRKIVGVPSDKIEIIDGVVKINDNIIKENTDLNNNKYVLEKNTYFYIAENTETKDAGTVKENNIVGKRIEL